MPGAEFDIGNYVGLAASGPNVVDMIERLKPNSPVANAGFFQGFHHQADLSIDIAGTSRCDSDSGATFIDWDGIVSAMEA